MRTALCFCELLLTTPKSTTTDSNMAILEDLGLEVKILVNNSPLKEYEDKEAGPTDDGFGEEIRKCRRYVEVVEDAEFAVQLHVTPANNYLNDANKRISFVLDLDGQENFEEALLNRKRTQHLVEGKDEANGEKTVRRNFRFTAVATGTYPKIHRYRTTR